MARPVVDIIHPCFLTALALWLMVGCNPEEMPPEEEAPAEQIAVGKKLFMSNGCVLCHGDSGDGKGRIAHTLSPAPRDFSDIAAYKQGHEVEHIAFSIAHGLGDSGAMPAYPHIGADDRRAMAQYIHSLQDGGIPEGDGG